MKQKLCIFLTSLRFYLLITLQLLFRFQKAKIASRVMVSANSTVLCFQTKIVLQKQKPYSNLSQYQNFIPNVQLKWELLKYEIRNFTIDYSKKLAKERKENKTLLENKLKELEGNLNTEDNIQSYNFFRI